MSFDLGWGNAVCVRHAFLKGIELRTVFFSLDDKNLSYTPHDGDAKLIEITRRVIERQVGPTYKHIFLTNGASGGATIAMRAYAQRGYKTCITRTAPYFSIYPGMIDAAGLKHITGVPEENCVRPILLIDSPSNPHGEVVEDLATTIPVIWDAVYHSRVYGAGNFKAMHSDVIVGSYSKLLGFNGIRTGWIATNDDVLALRIKNLVESEYCGLSSASNVVLLQVLKNYRSKNFWENFEHRARLYLDCNREEWSRLEKFFGQKPVGEVGMFYYAPMDSACKRLMEKSGVVWTPGSRLGHEDSYGRISLGQDCELTLKAVKEILKNDRR